MVDLQLGPGSLVTSVFSEMDGNQDGEITPEEFVEVLLRILIYIECFV